jgi:hypothetical protein
LKKIIPWLEAWHSLDNNGKLTNDTSNALHHTTGVLLDINDIIDYSFEIFSISYLLPGKFTTDKLEKRFGKYRLMAGYKYNVSFDDIMNAGKKIDLNIS